MAHRYPLPLINSGAHSGTPAWRLQWGGLPTGGFGVVGGD